MKEKLDQLFIERYDYLLECAHNILKLVNRTDLDTTLLSDAYQYVIANQHKIEEDKIEASIIRWMTMQIKWKGTTFKKQWIYVDKKINNNIDTSSLNEIDETITEEDLLKNEVLIEDKLRYIFHSVDGFTLDNKILFEAVFLNGINTSGKLAKHTGISRTSCYYLIKNLKTKLNDGYKNNEEL
jgi:hypothetical protein